MELIDSKRFQGAARALARLHEAVSKDNLSEIERDGLIQRFELRTATI